MLSEDFGWVKVLKTISFSWLEGLLYKVNSNLKSKILRYLIRYPSDEYTNNWLERIMQNYNKNEDPQKQASWKILFWKTFYACRIY